MDLQITDRLW